MADPIGYQSPTGLCRVAQVYSATEAALAVCALEGAGFRVFVPGYQTISTLPHLSVALGGMPVLVDGDRAREAATLLTHIQAANQSPGAAAGKEASAGPGRLSVRKLVFAAIFVLTGTAPPLHACFKASPPS